MPTSRKQVARRPRAAGRLLAPDEPEALASPDRRPGARSERAQAALRAVVEQELAGRGVAAHAESRGAEQSRQRGTVRSVVVDDAVYPLVIRAGGGSPRDTLSVLDQLQIRSMTSIRNLETLKRLVTALEEFAARTAA